MFIPVIFGKKKNDDEKDRQIRDLRVSFPGIRRPSNDDAVFEMLFEVDRVYSTLRVYLHPDFPASKPVLQVVGPVTHAWLDRYKQVIGCEKLNSWTKNSSLAEVVQTTLAVLQSGVNVNASQYPSGTVSTPPPSTSGTSSALSAYPGHTQSTQSPPYDTTQGRGPSPPYVPPRQGSIPGQPGGTYMNPYPTLPQATGGSYSYPHTSSPTPPHTTNSTIVSGNQNYYAQNHGNTGDSYSQNYQPPPSYDSPTPSHQFNPRDPHTPKSLDYMHDRSPPPRLSSEKPSPFDCSNRPCSTEIPIPSIPQSFPDISNLSSFQLEKLTKDDVAIEAMVRRISAVQPMGDLTQQLREQNQEQAELNLVKETELNILLKEVSALQNKLKTENAAYEKKLQIAKTKYGSVNTDLVRQIEAKKESLDLHSESLSKAFIGGNIDTNSFLQDYLDSRISYHKVSAKLSALYS